METSDSLSTHSCRTQRKPCRPTKKVVNSCDTSKERGKSSQNFGGLGQVLESTRYTSGGDKSTESSLFLHSSLHWALAMAFWMSYIVTNCEDESPANGLPVIPVVSSRSKDSTTTSQSSTSTMKKSSESLPSALKSSLKARSKQDQREDSSCDDGNSTATPTCSLPQPRAVRFSPGVSSTTTSSIDESFPDLPPTLHLARQPLGRKARQVQVRKLLQMSSSRQVADTEDPSFQFPLNEARNS